MRALAVLLLFVAPAALAAPVPKELKQNDLARIAGTWALTGSCSAAGQNGPPDGSSWSFTADGKATIHRGNNQPSADGIKYVLDQTTSPKSFDWICPWGEWYGVYELKDDTFTIYLKSHAKNDAEKIRPAQLANGPGIEMYSFKRSAAAK